MKNTLSLLTITKNASETLEKMLESVKGLPAEIIVVDDYSSDDTVEIASRFGADIYPHTQLDLGKQKQYGLDQTKCDWVLILDADEQLSPALKEEIHKILRTSSPYDAYIIPYQNHFLGKPIKHGGENYKMLRLFRRDKAVISSALVHEHVSVSSEHVGELKHRIYHYSYRTLPQMFIKFTGYAYREALQKAKQQENTTLKKLTMYPAHMFYARYIKDKGYKDGLLRALLDIGFAYMEFLTYVILPFVKKGDEKKQVRYARR